MKQFNFFLVCGLLLTAMFLVTGCDNKEPENPMTPVPDPPGTIRISVRDANNGDTRVTPDGFWDSFGIRDGNFVTRDGGIQFASIGRVNGLGNVIQIPELGWANSIAVIPGYGYVAKSSGYYARIFVVDWIESATGEIIGAEIQYQAPFEVGSIELGTDTLNFVSEGGSQTIQVSSDGVWTMSSWNYNLWEWHTTLPNWITISPNSGTGNAVVTVTVTENEALGRRTNRLRFSSGTQTAIVTISQEGSPFELDTNTLNFASKGGSQTIQVSTNGKWRILGQWHALPDWITVSPQSGMGNATVTVTAIESESFAIERKEELTFRCEEGFSTIAKVTITQEVRPLYDNPQGVVINGVRWATRNVDVPGTFADRPESSGMLFQWNRRTGWATTGTVSGWDSSVPAGTTWESVNNPCPPGWRVPTETEFQTLLNTGVVIPQRAITNDISGWVFVDRATHNHFFLPAVGVHRSNFGGVQISPTTGLYWSSTLAGGTLARVFSISNWDMRINFLDRASGLSVRCVAE